MSDLLQLVVSEGSSDLHIRVGVPPVIRVHGILHRVEGPVLKPEDTEELMRSITSEEHIQSVRERGGADFGFAFGEAARFRVSVFKEKGNFAMVLRQIPSKLLTFEQIGIPPVAKELLYKPRGLILVTGPTGSGKTTTLASMINIFRCSGWCRHDWQYGQRLCPFLNRDSNILIANCALAIYQLIDPVSVVDS